MKVCDIFQKDNINYELRITFCAINPKYSPMQYSRSSSLILLLHRHFIKEVIMKTLGVLQINGCA